MADYQTTSSILLNRANNLRMNCLFLSGKIGEKILELSTDFDNIANVLDSVASKIHNGNMNKAEQLYKEACFVMSNNTLCRRLWSEAELTKWLNENTTNGKIKDFCEKMGTGCRILKTFKGYIDKIEPATDIAKSIYNIYFRQKIYHLHRFRKN